MNHASALFVSDLHLSGDQPETCRRFLGFLETVGDRAAALYILGDLFDYWIGDDALVSAPVDDLAKAVTDALRALTRRGVLLSIMHGNRDFLLGSGFAQASGAALIDDPTLVTLGGTPTVLLHGDTLCTEDHAYQAFRAIVRGQHWQQAFLARPLAERKAEMAALRRQSEQVKRDQPIEIMDVHLPAVESAFRSQGVRQMIHGHTHRPARHRHEVDGQTCVRWVLPDWTDSGGYLIADAQGIRAERC